MLVDLPYRQAALAVLCLVPAVMRWWSGRSLLPLLDDPVLPERILEHRRRNQVGLGFVCAGFVIFGSFTDLIWALPLLIVARAAAGFPFRRALYDERWSFWGFMAGMTRLLVAIGGIRLALAFAPVIPTLAGTYDWIAAIALCGLLLLWWNRSADWFRAVLRTRPLDEGALLDRCRAIAAASTAPQPRFELIDLRGGAIANAVALPSSRGSSVLYTDTLLRLLDADEAVAITAHEVAHLEQYDAAKLRTVNRTMIALILGATGAALLPRLFPVLSLLFLEAAWSMIYAATLVWLSRDHQRNETASDLRAVQLCGNAEALVRGLTKIHTFARVPRRWDTQMEHSASHPSLARRIRAIRAAAAPAQPPAAEPSTQAPATAAPAAAETIRSADGRTAVTFGDALHWHEPEGALHVLPYAQLTELRLDARGGMKLVALERGGRRWVVAIDPAEAARAQPILDRVDGRLSEPPPRTFAVPWLQAAGAIVAVAAMWAGQIVVALLAIGAALRSVAAFFAAAGAAALGAAALVGREAIETGRFTGAWPALVLAVCGVGLLAGAWRKREDEIGGLVKAAIGGLAALALLSVGAIAVRSGDAVRLYQASAALPSAAILPLALAGALAIRPRRAWRIAAVPVCLVGLMIGIAGSGTFLHAFGRDPFLVSADPLPVVTLTGTPIADVTLPGVLSGVRFSPNGKRIALMKYTANMRHVTVFMVGAPGSEFTSIPGTDLLFIDDDRVLVMLADGVRALVHEVRLGSEPIAWEQEIADLSGPRLSYRRAANRWVVTGMDDEGKIVSVEGAVGGGDVKRREWSLTERDQMTEAWAVDGETVLRANRSFPFDPGSVDAFSLTMAAMLSQTETRLTRITPQGQVPVAVSRLDATCTDHALGSERIVCLAYDGAHTRVFAFSPASDAPEPIGSIAGRVLVSQPSRDGWLSGWTMTGSGAMTMPTYMLIDLVGRRTIAMPVGLGVPQEIAAAGRVVGTVTHETASTRVRLYALDR